MEKTQEELDLENELEIAGDECEKAFNECPPNLDICDFQEYMRPFNRKCAEISRKLRMIKTPVFSELSTFGDVMPIEEFISAVECGGFIDYDGYGRYVKDSMETDISIYPSDHKNGSIRKDFDTIIWFNR